MELSDKIKLILESTNFTPSIFADEIGVQRSSISHILAGRNKPSLDVVQKIIKRFPDFGVNWILDDESLPLLDKNINTSKPKTYNEKNEEISLNQAPEDLPARTTQHRSVKEANVTPILTDNIIEKRAIKIMVLYSDGTFQEFNPTKSIF